MIEGESIRKVGITIHHPLIIMNIVEMKFTSIAARTPPGRATGAAGTVGIVEFGIRARPTTAGRASLSCENIFAKFSWKV
jgi:hypothetical protein